MKIKVRAGSSNGGDGATTTGAGGRASSFG